MELLTVLEKDAVKVSRETDRLYDLYQSEMIDKYGFKEKYRLLAERRDQLNDQIPKLQAEIDILKISQLSQETAIEEARNLYSHWPSLPFEEKRRTAEAIIEKIIIGDGEIDINLFYTPPPVKLGGSENQGSINSIYTPLNHDKKATQPQRRVAFLPFVHISLKSLIKKPYDFEPKTFGEHILKRRLFLNLTQAELAKLFNVGLTSIVNWENDHTEPELRYTPTLIEFLGYDPLSINPNSIGELLLAKRRQYGWNQQVAAEKLGVDRMTFLRWERGGMIRLPKYRKLAAVFLGVDEDIFDEKMKIGWSERCKR